MTDETSERVNSDRETISTPIDPGSLDGLAAGDTMMQMIKGFQLSRAIYVATELGIADLLAEDFRTPDDLAAATHTHAQSLFRLLRALASAGVFSEDEWGRFGPTPLSRLLRSDAPGSLRSWALNMVGRGWDVWRHLKYSIESGEPAFPHIHGMSAWEYNEKHSAANDLFNDAMVGISALEVETIVKAYDFTGISRLVDLGGGHGALLASILGANPHLEGTLFDLPHVVEGAREALNVAGVASRCSLVAGDIFIAVPDDGDAYIMKSILHDWSDDLAIAILQTCRASMPVGARLLVADRVIPPGNAAHVGKFLDLQMMVMLGGRERSAAEFEQLLAAGGFTITRIIATGRPMSIIEAVMA